MASNFQLPSDLIESALILLVLVSVVVRKVTRVPIFGICQLNPGQELGRTNKSFPSSVVMKPKCVVLSIAFTAPVMNGCVCVVELPLCWIVSLTFSLTSLPGSGV